MNISKTDVGYKNAIVFNHDSIEKIRHISGNKPILDELTLRTISLIAKFNDPPYVIKLCPIGRNPFISYPRHIYVLPKKLNKYEYAFFLSRSSNLKFSFRKYQNTCTFYVKYFIDILAIFIEDNDRAPYPSLYFSNGEDPQKTICFYSNDNTEFLDGSSSSSDLSVLDF